MVIKRKSPLSGQVRTMDIPVTQEQIAEWKKGAPIQTVMGHLTLDQREFIMTGITATEWENHFKEEWIND